MIEKGNMTDAEFIAALIAENKKLKAEQAKLEKAIDILETKKRKVVRRKRMSEKRLPYIS